MKLFQSYRHSLPRIIRNCFREGRARKPSEKRNGGARCSQTTASTRPLADTEFVARSAYLKLTDVRVTIPIADTTSTLHFLLSLREERARGARSRCTAQLMPSVLFRHISLSRNVFFFFIFPIDDGSCAQPARDAMELLCSCSRSGKPGSRFQPLLLSCKLGPVLFSCFIPKFLSHVLSFSPLIG